MIAALVDRVPLAFEERGQLSEAPASNLVYLDRAAVRNHEEVALRPETVALRLIVRAGELLQLRSPTLALGLNGEHWLVPK